ncbi:hypothetical protein [Nocardia testacea]|uniref:hypothetical protein n=1 Tax=Nocardia testacea TaxID=248551 RepID=UPI003A83A76A
MGIFRKTSRNPEPPAEQQSEPHPEAGQARPDRDVRRRRRRLLGGAYTGGGSGS